ncbi:hypothetical protein H4J45_05340 [Colwellia sp. BRX10-6]|uniref:hypothetical protein n=1 Tax=unclassified Colwellia TaxID=196834 RepID=UPI0015F5ECEA|nr:MULTISPECIES: hypothetical protein [unclassified Colwellia]MBA6381810.1 hypothetical protein [Colwellia sp. BRX10-9]MBA6393509.1 hypothetical protein [Colwellia sp. BRX10-6]
MTHYRYLRNLITISLALFIIFGTFNYFINPYNIFNIERFIGFNTVKPESSKRIRIFKKYQPVYANPNLLIVGNSRVEMGLDPMHGSFNDKLIVYNLGIPGIGVISQLQYTQNVIENSDIQELIIAIDFADFLTTKNYKFTPPSLNISPLSDKYGALWSLDSLKASIITIFKQNQFAANRLKNGFNPANDYQPIIKFEGQGVLFKQKIKMLNNMFKNKVWDEKSMLTHEKSHLSILQKYIRVWMENGIKVNIFINPYHREYYTIMAENDLLDSFNSWRTLMKNVFSSKISYCDFTNLGHEKSDDKLTENELKYFWEPAHYKRELGDIMIPKILNGCA